MTRWSWRVLALVAGWAGAVAALGLLQMRPAVTVLAALAGVVAATLWMVLDVSDVAVRADWRATADGSGTTGGGDARVGALRRQIADARVFEDNTSLHRSLVALADEALRLHGVDRTTQPARAAALLGPPLTSFVSLAPDREVIGDPRRLDVLVSRLEQLAAGPPAPSPQEIR